MEKGKRYNKGKLRWSLLDMDCFEPMIRVRMYGAHKYAVYLDKEGREVRGSQISEEEAEGLKKIYDGAEDWRKGLDKVEILESMLRHVQSLLRYERTKNPAHRLDEESKEHHIGHVMCNAQFYSYFDVVQPKENEGKGGAVDTSG